MGMALGIAAGSLQAAGGLFQGLGARQEALEEHAIAKTEARLAQAAAADAIRRGDVEAGSVRQQASRLIGQQQAIAGASGLSMDSSPITSAALTTRAFSELDVATLKDNALAEAWGLEIQSDVQLRRAESAARRARWAPVGHILAGFGQGAGSVAGGLR